MRYFAYGTNVNLAVFQRKGLAFLDRCGAMLPDYRLSFNKKSLRPLLPAAIGFANIVPSPGDEVEGVLYRMPDDALPRLDQLERCPEHYARIDVVVHTEQGPVTGLTYTALRDKTADDLRPSRNYINYILAEQHYLSPAYLDRLQRLETYSSECAACHKVANVLFHKEGETMFVLCQPCLEAKRIWGETLGRALTVLDTEAVMLHLRRTGRAYDTVLELIDDAIRLNLLAPRDGKAGK